MKINLIIIMEIRLKTEKPEILFTKCALRNEFQVSLTPQLEEDWKRM